MPIQKQFLLPVLLLFLAGSCTTPQTDSNPASEDQKEITRSAEAAEQWKPVRINDKMGYRDLQGRLVIDAFYLNAEAFHHGVAIVQDESGYCLINFKGEKISAYYAEIKPNTFNNGNSFIAKKINDATQDLNSNKQNTNDKDIRKRLQEELNHNETDNTANSTENNIPITTPDSVCVINIQGKQISAYFNQIKPTQNGSYIGTNILNEKFVNSDAVLINALGKEISKHVQKIEDYNSCLMAKNKEQYFLMNPEGQPISESYYEITALDDRGNFKCKKTKEALYSIIDSRGKERYPASFTTIEWNKKHQFYVIQKKSTSKFNQGILSQNLQEILKAEHLIRCYNDQNWVAFSKGKTFAFYTYEQEKFSKVSDEFDVEQMQITTGGKTIHLAGRTIGSRSRTIMVYSIPEFHQGLARVNRNNKYGFINDQLKMAIPMEYDFCEDRFNNGKCYVEKNGKGFFIDPTGKEVLD